MTCQEQAVALCQQLGPLGPIVFTMLGLALAAFERWNARRKLAEKDAAIAKVKAQRNEHAAKAQALEVKIASIRPGPPDQSAGVES